MNTIKIAQDGLRAARKGFIALSGAIAALLGVGHAQIHLPERINVDGNGVDLATGALIIPGPSISIGQPGAGGLSYSLAYYGYTSGWHSNVMGSAVKLGSTYYVSSTGESDTFVSSGGALVSAKGSGATLTVQNTPSGVNLYTYTSASGVVTTLNGNLTGTSSTSSYVSQEVHPTGEVVDYHWVHTSYCKVNEPDVPGCQITKHFYRLQSVTNNFGYMLHFDYANNSTPTDDASAATWQARTKATALNRAVDDCHATAATCTFSKTWPSLTGAYTDQSGRTYQFTYTNGKLTGVKLPGSANDNLTIAYDANNRVSAVDRGFGAWTYAYADADTNGDQIDDERTTTVTDPLSKTRVVKSEIATSLIKSDKDALNRTVLYQHDSNGRTTRATSPEGDYTQYAYDARGNVTTQTRAAKPGSGLPNIVASAAYPSSCANIVTCNKPTSTTDARGKTTNYTYNSIHGGVLTVTAPDPDGGGPLARPQIRYAFAQKQARYYNGFGAYANGAAIWRVTETTQCSDGSSCAGAATETKTTIDYPAASTPNNLLPLSVTTAAGDGSVSSAISAVFDAFGNLETADGPLPGSADAVKYYYDAARQVTGVVGPDPDGAGSLKRRAVKMTYNPWGQPTISERGTVNDQTATAFNSFTRLEKAETVYDSFGRPVQNRLFDANGSTILAVVQTSYDALGRTDCVARRMTPGLFGSLPPSACSLGAGNGENDRISRTIYDDAGRAVRAIAALSTSLQQDAVTTSYTLNGLVETVTDAKGNKTTYEYDGHGQLIKTRYPHPSAVGTSSTTDYDLNAYNYGPGFGGVLTGSTRRDGQVFAYAYDGLGRVILRNAPGSDPDISYAYDNFGRLLSASQAGHALAYAYDALGRRLSETGPLGSVSYQYDAAGRRTRIAWPDGFYVQYDYDATGAMTKVRENGAASGVGVLASYSYDDLGRRVSIARGNGATTTYGFDAASRLASLAHDAAGTANDQDWGFSYNPAGQILAQTATNSAWNWSYGSDSSDAYTSNGLNQYLTAGAAQPVYDGRGNMTNDGLGRVMGYDADNRLTSVARTVAAATTTSTLSYDPAGRLSRLAATAGATTNFLYDGAQAIAEYDGSNALLRRYVPGAGVDETLVWYEGSGVSDRRWLLTDARGSVIAIANASGVVTARNKYDDYGAPDAGNVGRFQYTGQMWLAEAGLYHYKARAYHPELGRFLQTDPIGYGDGMNMYAYVSNDPVNSTDPSGLIDEIVVQGVNHGYPTGGGFSFGGGGGGGGSFAGGEPIDEIVVVGHRPKKRNSNPSASISIQLDFTNAAAPVADAINRSLCGDTGGVFSNGAAGAARAALPDGSPSEISNLSRVIAEGYENSYAAIRGYEYLNSGVYNSSYIGFDAGQYIVGKQRGRSKRFELWSIANPSPPRGLPIYGLNPPRTLAAIVIAPSIYEYGGRKTLDSYANRIYRQAPVYSSVARNKRVPVIVGTPYGYCTFGGG